MQASGRCRAGRRIVERAARWHHGPVARGRFRDDMGLVGPPLPRGPAGVLRDSDIFERAVREAVRSQEQNDLLHRVEFRTAGRQMRESQVGWWNEKTVRSMPTCPIRRNRRARPSATAAARCSFMDAVPGANSPATGRNSVGAMAPYGRCPRSRRRGIGPDGSLPARPCSSQGLVRCHACAHRTRFTPPRRWSARGSPGCVQDRHRCSFRLRQPRLRARPRRRPGRRHRRPRGRDRRSSPPS